MATPHMQDIHGKKAALFRDGTHPVYLLPDGRFAVKWNGDWRYRTTLRAIDKLTSADRPHVALMQVGHSSVSHDCSARKLNVAEMADSWIIDKEGKRHYRGWGDWFLFDQERFDKLANLEDRRQAAEMAFKGELEEIMRGACRVASYNLKEAIAGTLPQPDSEDDD